MEVPLAKASSSEVAWLCMSSIAESRVMVVDGVVADWVEAEEQMDVELIVWKLVGGGSAVIENELGMRRCR